MDCFLFRLRGIKLDELGLDRTEIGGARYLRTKIDRDDAAATGFRGRRQRLQRRLDPAPGGLRELEIASAALGAARFKSCVQGLANRAELGIGGVAERENAELDAIETRRPLAHEFTVSANGPRVRITFIPGRGDDDETPY